jgi:CheY-like chemotaxis protein
VGAFLRELLEEDGYTVEVFTQGQAALAALREAPTRYAAVVTDLTMHEMTGLELATAVHRSIPTLPVLLCTGAADMPNHAALAAAGVPVPAGRVLRPGEPLPEAFIRPAVVKALASCGGDGVMHLPRGADLPPSPVPRRIEPAVAGTSVGVSCLCGPAGVFPLPPVRHHFSAGSMPRFIGGDTRLRPGPERRASSLAGRTVRGIADATQPACGWVGVDMILGEREDGADDRVLEVNPRLTTSFVGLATLGETSLLEAMLSVAGGETCRWPAGLSGGDGTFLIAGEGADASSVAHTGGPPGR